MGEREGVVFERSLLLNHSQGPRLLLTRTDAMVGTSGYCIQLSIYINIESLSDTEKEVRPGVSGKTDSFLVGVLFFKMFYSNHQLGQKRILSFSPVIKALQAELFNDVPELSDLDSLQYLPLAQKS